MAVSAGSLVWWLPALVPSYLILCSSLRFRRRNEIQKKFPDRASLAQMTTVEAQEIVNKLTELEFPLTVLTSLQFALFKVSGERVAQGSVSLISPRPMAFRLSHNSLLIRNNLVL